MHDPIHFATSLSAKLATRSRHVCALLGAGVGRACGLPDVAQLQGEVLAGLTGEEKKTFESQLEGRNLEEALSRLRRIAALVSGDQRVDGLTAALARALDDKVCQLIVRALDIKKAKAAPAEYFAAWAAHSDYRFPLEIFTVNYDLLLETALESWRVPYFDGFVGTLRARFHTDLVEAIPGNDGECVPGFFVRLWKLHGSVNWAWQGGPAQIVRLGQPVPEAAAIYPSDTKYEDSRRVPFVVLQDRFRRALHQPETLLIVTGYSFGDAHLNELIFDAAARRERSEFVVFCYSEIPGTLAQRATVLPNLQVVTGREAILGGVRAKWKIPENETPSVWEAEQFALRDFGKLAAYLARSANREPEADARLQALIEEAVAKRETESKAVREKNG